MKQIGSVDEALDFAISREIEAHDFYKDLAEAVQKPDLRKTLRNFAADELEHRIKLKAVKAGRFRIKPERVGHLGIADIVRPMQPRPGMSYAETLIVAMRKEKKAFKLCVDLARMAQTEKIIRKLFLLLAPEEANHKLQLEIEYDLETF